MIYGVGDLPVRVSTCKVVPAAMGGFFQFRPAKQKKPKVEPKPEENLKVTDMLIEKLNAKRQKKQ